MGIVIPFPSRVPRANRRCILRRRQPMGTLDVPARGEGQITFVPRGFTKIERLLFHADEARELFVESLTIGIDDMLLGTIPMVLLAGAPIDLPTMMEGAVLTLSVKSASRDRIVLPVRAEVLLHENELRRR